MSNTTTNMTGSVVAIGKSCGTAGKKTAVGNRRQVRRSEARATAALMLGLVGGSRHDPMDYHGSPDADFACALNTAAMLGLSLYVPRQRRRFACLLAWAEMERLQADDCALVRHHPLVDAVPEEVEEGAGEEVGDR